MTLRTTMVTINIDGNSHTEVDYSHPDGEQCSMLGIDIARCLYAMQGRIPGGLPRVLAIIEDARIELRKRQVGNET